MEHLKEVKAVCTYIPYYNEEKNYTIAKFKTTDGSNYSFSLKGSFFAKTKNEYVVTGINTKDDKYPDTYAAITVKPNVNLENVSDKNLVSYLSFVTSEAIAYKLVSEIPDIIKVIEDEDIDTLQQVKGVGQKVAEKIINMHAEQVDFSVALIKLAKYGLTETAIKSLVKHFKSSEKAIDVIENNPYDLTSVKGYGFKRCDTIFLLGNMDNPDATKDKRRVSAYIDFLFKEQGDDGNTWLTPKEFMNFVIEFIPEVDVTDAIDYVNNSGKYVTITVNGSKRITSVRYMHMELEVADLLLAKLEVEDTKEIKNVDEIILHVETGQGFEFDEDQKQAIYDMLKYNVFLLQGYGGTGKSSTINAVSRVLRENDYIIGQCALSGKAADNLAKVTGFRGKTIHSMIKYGSHKPYNENNPMPYDVVILDEVSMVNIEIFSALLKAMKEGSRLIMLGDGGQLDSIGVAVMPGMMFSGGKIPGTTLTKIHRQAQESAIVTHSIAIRNGTKPQELLVKSNTNRVYGAKNDFEYIFTKNSDEKSIYKYALIRFKNSIEKYGVDNTQILCAAKSAGTASVHTLNYYAQMAANPSEIGKLEYRIGEEETGYVLREGDKVINVRNNYNTCDIHGNESPIFNGNTGTILSMDLDGRREMIIRFDGIGDIVMPLAMLKDSIQLGYAITTHKAQGSTIESVIVALPFHFMLNSRELLYTAVTRASKRVTLVTSPKSFQGALRKTSKKTQQTNLDIYLQDLDTYSEKLLDKKKGVK